MDQLKNQNYSRGTLKILSGSQIIDKKLGLSNFEFLLEFNIKHVLCATYEKKVNNNNTKENEYFINIGKSGLRQMD